ncbi:tolB protein-like protein [Perilla frutescens var. hirtella]|uniref:TolB protein-like protein n=1 Tax=Perilla frutescens var. hirtella TaxID=608512 RepID=A0AAD4J008_PERFH|nr:tolB protein-like protein [Perilla frutescens var. hirtella]
MSSPDYGPKPANLVPLDHDMQNCFSEHCLTDGISINFNGQFIDDDKTIVYISERTGSARIFLNRSGDPHPKQLHTATESLFHDRPAVKNGRLYFISTHEPPDKPFTSWSALYAVTLGDKTSERLTPYGFVDYSRRGSTASPLQQPRCRGCLRPGQAANLRRKRENSYKKKTRALISLRQIVNFPAELRRSDSLGDGGEGGGNTFSFIGIKWGVKSGGGIGIIVGIVIGVGVVIYGFTVGYQHRHQRPGAPLVLRRGCLWPGQAAADLRI